MVGLGLVVGRGHSVVGNAVVGNTVVGHAVVGHTVVGNTVVGNTVVGKTAMDSVDGGDVVLDHGLVVGGAVVGHAVGGVVGRVGDHGGVHSVCEGGVGEGSVGNGANIVVDEGGHRSLVNGSLLRFKEVR